MKNKPTAKKIGIIFPGNIYTTPYLKRYTDIIEQMGIPYDIIYWNTEGIEEESSAANKYCLEYPITSVSSAAKKALGYLKFFWMAGAVILREKYDKVIVLTSVPAVCLHGILCTKYKNKFIIDIRDYYKEHIKLYYLPEKKAIECSALAVISSKGYQEFLPPYHYVIAHNINWLSPDVIRSFRSERKDNKSCINLSYIGSMRFPQQDRAVIDYFANDERFHINFFGSGYGIHKAYCEEKNINNVSIMDWFPPEKTIELYRKTDIVLNLYGNGTPVLDFALSNKLYYSAQLGKPILVCPKTYMEQVSTSYHFGFTFDPEAEDIKSKLYQYYQTMDWEKLYAGCDSYLQTVRQEDGQFVNRIMEFLLAKETRL